MPWTLLSALIVLVAFVSIACTAAAPVPTTAPVRTTAPPQNNAAAAITSEETKETQLLPASPPPFSTSEWTTDFARRTIPWEEIVSGGPPKDGIPAIDNPTVESIAAAAAWLSRQDPVIVFAAGDDVRAYPLAILIWHEIVNDTVGGQPASVTFCPLCNASIVFDRTFAGQVLDFGTTGRLRNSDLIMYDRQSETWWQQFTGQGIVGQYAGEQLAFLPSQVLSFADFAAEFPQGQVLARPTVARSYGTNPYTGYDSTAQPFLFRGELDSRLPATERIAGAVLPGVVKAYPFAQVAAVGVINDQVAAIPLVVLHKAGTASALDTSTISEGRDIGSVAVFDRRVGNRTLTFAPVAAGVYTDQETGSTWNILGRAVAGSLAGTQLTQILAFDHFWFAWSAFHPDTELYHTP